MTKAEAQQANTIHAIWDIIVMHYSIESAVDTYDISIADIENVCYKLREKCNEAKGA